MMHKILSLVFLLVSSAVWGENVPKITGTPPISVASGVVSISQATTSTNGYLSSADWNTFNNKTSLPSQSGHAFEFLTTNGTVASWAEVPSAEPGGSTTSIQYNNAGVFGGFGTWDGSLMTVNSVAISGATASTVPYLNSSKVLTSSAVTPTELGYVSGVTSAIQTQLNGKQSTLTLGDLSTSTTGVTIGSGTGAVVGSGTTVNIATASGAATGLLTSSDWTTFNSKQAALTPGSISTSTTGVSVGSGSSSTVGPNVTINVQTANGSQPGLISAADWTTFNSKQAALPSQSGHSGEFLTTDGSVLSWAAVPATTPGGADTSIQYNNGGSFGGFGTYDGSLLTIPTTKVGAQLGIGALPRTDSATYSSVDPVNLSGTNQIGVYIDQVFSSAATSGINGYAVNLTQADGITTSYAINFSAGGMIEGSGSTITRALNFFGSVPTAGTNNVWGADNVSFSGDYVLNFSSTNPSFFAGPIVLDGLTASRAVVTDSSKNLSSSATTSTQLAYLSSAAGTTGTASSNLVFSASPTFSGTVTMPSGSVTSSAWGTGTSTLDVGGILTVRKDNNGVSRLQIRNDDTGSSAYSQLKLTSDQGDLNINVNSGAAGDSVQLTADSAFAGGFQIGILGTNSLSLATNGTTAVNFDSNQKMTVATSGNGQFHQIYGRGLNISYNSSTTGYVALNNAHASGAAGFDVSASGGGDAFFAASTSSSGIYWTWGLDNSDSDAFVLSNSSALGSSSALRITPSTLATLFSGSVGIRTAPTTSSHLIVGGTSQLSTTTQYGILTNPTISSSATVGAYGIASEITFANASFTVPFAIQVAAAGVSAVGGTATITRAVGFFGSTQTAGTNNANFADNIAFTGNWFINSTSTNPSLFSGVVNASLGVRTKYATTDVSNPPTAAELASACGTAATGLTCVVNDAGGGTLFWDVASDGTNWFYTLMTKAL